MKKIMTFLMAAVVSVSAQAASFSGGSSLTGAFLHMNGNGRQFSLSYNGYLFNDCENGQGNLVNVYFIFSQAHQPQRVVKRTMSFSCNTPWNYSAPTQAVFSDYGRDAELWNALNLSIRDDGSAADFEVAFEYDGQWDSDYGRNYPLYLGRVD